MMKRFIMLFLASAVLIGLTGCGEAELTDEKIIEVVQNSYFEGYSQKTIGEYCTNYADRYTADENWNVASEEPGEELLELEAAPFSVDFKNERLIRWQIVSKGVIDNKTTTFIFSYNKSTKAVEPISFLYESDNDGILAFAAREEDMDIAVDNFVEIANGKE